MDPRNLGEKFWQKFKRPLAWGLLIFLLGGFGGLFVQKYLAPFLASKPVFSSFGFLRTDSPLVITRTEQIRVNENIRLVDLVKQLTPKAVLILGGRGSSGEGAFEERVRGSGIIVSSDGVIATDSSLLADNRNNYLVVLPDGKVLPAQFLASDSKSNVSLLKVANGDFSVVNFGESNKLELGQQLVVISGSEANNVSHLRITYVSQSPMDLSTNSVFGSENYVQNFGTGEQTPVGAGIFDLFGQLVGLSTSEGIVPAEAVSSAVENYFTNQEIRRPLLGVGYSVITKSSASILNLSSETGIVLKSQAGQAAVRTGSPAAAAGLQEGDIIIKINGQDVGLAQTLDSHLNRAKPGDEWRLTILRGGQESEVVVILGEL